MLSVRCTRMQWKALKWFNNQSTTKSINQLQCLFFPNSLLLLQSRPPVVFNDPASLLPKIGQTARPCCSPYNGSVTFQTRAQPSAHIKLTHCCALVSQVIRARLWYFLPFDTSWAKRYRADLARPRSHAFPQESPKCRLLQDSRLRCVSRGTKFQGCLANPRDHAHLRSAGLPASRHPATCGNASRHFRSTELPTSHLPKAPLCLFLGSFCRGFRRRRRRRRRGSNGGNILAFVHSWLCPFRQLSNEIYMRS